LIVASPPPLAFWRRGIAWRSADRFGTGSFDFSNGLHLDAASMPLGLDDPRLAQSRERDAHIRAFLVWSRMPIVIKLDGKAFLTDQRFYSAAPSPFSTTMRKMVRRSAFLIPLDIPHPNS
jgi:inner membrane protein